MRFKNDFPHQQEDHALVRCLSFLECNPAQSRAWYGFCSSDYPLFAPRLVHMPVDGLHSIAEKEDRVFDF